MSTPSTQVLSLYVGDEVPREELVRMAKLSYEDAFAHELTTPVVKLVCLRRANRACSLTARLVVGAFLTLNRSRPSRRTTFTCWSSITALRTPSRTLRFSSSETFSSTFWSGECCAGYAIVCSWRALAPLIACFVQGKSAHWCTPALPAGGREAHHRAWSDERRHGKVCAAGLSCLVFNRSWRSSPRTLLE